MAFGSDNGCANQRFKKAPRKINPLQTVLSIVGPGCDHAFENESLQTPQRNP